VGDRQVGKKNRKEKEEKWALKRPRRIDRPKGKFLKKLWGRTSSRPATDLFRWKEKEAAEENGRQKRGDWRGKVLKTGSNGKEKKKKEKRKGKGGGGFKSLSFFLSGWTAFSRLAYYHRLKGPNRFSTNKKPPDGEKKFLSSTSGELCLFLSRRREENKRKEQYAQLRAVCRKRGKRAADRNKQ